MSVIRDHLLEFPAEAACLVFVGCFDHEEDGADGEESATYKCCDTTGGAGFMWELGAGVGEWEPVEETADDEDGAADGEEKGDEEGDIPPRECGEHAANAFED